MLKKNILWGLMKLLGGLQPPQNRARYAHAISPPTPRHNRLLDEQQRKQAGIQ